MLQDKTILAEIPDTLKSVDISFLGEKTQGKVRDIYKINGKRILVTTDRQSAFDVILGHIPFKGQVLNLLSQFWFEQTQDIIASHMISVPHANVMIVKDCQPIPVEMVVRGYLSGVTKTSPWYSYEQGERLIYGIHFPDGLSKNQKLETPIITPTTHGGGKAAPVGSSRSASGTIRTRLTGRSDGAQHDERLTEEQILNEGQVDKSLYNKMKDISLKLFARGTEICAKAGLVLVDTKYEFGLFNGELTLIDEIHTPDSSRFWIGKTYQHRINLGMEPENYDKEFLRLWYKERGYLGDGPPPPMTNELIVQTAKRYISVYEKITGKTFEPKNINSIEQSLREWLRPVSASQFAAY